MSYLRTPRAYRQQGRKGTWCCDGTVLLPDGRRVRVVIKRATAREAGAAWQEEATRRIRSIPKSDQPIEQYLQEWLVRRAANVSANWTPKRDQRDLQGALRSDAGVSRSPEALEGICGSTQSSTPHWFTPHLFSEFCRLVRKVLVEVPVRRL
jgi:hypothetical protein